MHIMNTWETLQNINIQAPPKNHCQNVWGMGVAHTHHYLLKSHMWIKSAAEKNTVAMAWINSFMFVSALKPTKCMNSSFPCLSKRNSALRSYSAFLNRGRSHIQIYSIRCQSLTFPPWNQVSRKHQLYNWDKRANYSNLETWSHPIHPSQLFIIGSNITPKFRNSE